MSPFNIQGSQVNIGQLALGNCRPIIQFPSGLIPENEPGRDLDAVLASMNASFGFNQTAHTFKTTWIPTQKFILLHGASGNLPLTGRIIGFNIDNFLVSGIITHADYNTAGGQGTIITVDMEDQRSCLDRIKIHTEDLQFNPGSGIISIARAYRVNRGLFNSLGQVDDALFFEYQNILENGCTYPQILEAISLAVSEGELDFDLDTLPTVADFEANIGGNASAIRFKFAMAPLSEVVSRVCQDMAYDWYWNMAANAVSLVNRKTEFRLDEQVLTDVITRLGGSGLATVTRLSYGQDRVTDPRRARLLGARQEGFINSRLLSPIDGIDTPASGIVFEPAWRNLTIAFNDANGILRTYKATDQELRMALNGIETWTYFKKYQIALSTDDPPGFELPIDDGYIAAQDPLFESRLDPVQPIAGFAADDEEGSFRAINNRRDEEHNWILSWFSRVEDHARRHFGRSYVASGVLVTNASGALRLATSAWSNVENQIQGQPLSVDGSSGFFIPDYEINRTLGPVAPFKTVDDKIAAHVVLPSGTVYGEQGDDAPASFGNWTEDAPPFNPNGNGDHYIPVDLIEVGQQSVDPRGGTDLAFEDYPDGTILAQLPILAGSGLTRNPVLGSLITLTENALQADISGLIDVIDLARLVQPYTRLSGVAIPVQTTTRYGMNFPNEWVSGNLTVNCDNESVILDDAFAPWNFPPQGTQTSIKIMNDRAFRKLQGFIIGTDVSTFANIDIVGYPRISFDGFANQTPDSSGFVGVRDHGITEMTFSFAAQGFSTAYKIASFFSEFGKDAPLGERNRSILNGIINPIDFSTLALTDNKTPDRLPPRPTPPGLSPFPREEREITRVKVVITTVNNAIAFGFPDPNPFTQERYRGKTAKDKINPPANPFSNDLDRRDGAVCVDGFLNLGDEAIYVVERIATRITDFGSSRVTYNRYFTGGRPFANGTIVEVVAAGTTPGTFTVAIENSNPRRKLIDIPLLNGAINVGEKTIIVAEGG